MRYKLSNSIWGAVILSLIAVRILLAAITLFDADFILGWVDVGRRILSGRAFQGLYTGPGIIYAAMYGVWLMMTHDVGTYDTIRYLYSHGPMEAWSSLTVSMFAFTFVMKIPLIVADAAVVLLIMRVVSRITGSAERSYEAAVLWLASPLVFLLEMSNTVEIYPALAIAASAYLVSRFRIRLASATLAVGAILRVFPVFVSGLYLVAFFRNKQRRYLFEFLVIQVASFALGLLYAYYAAGIAGLAFVFSSRPGILIPEALLAIGPFLSFGTLTDPYFSLYGANPFGLGLTAVASILVTYLVTSPERWNSRVAGIEVIALLSTFFALTDFFGVFFLWLLPALLIYSATTNFGAKRFLLITVSALLFVVIQESSLLAAYGRALFLVPNANSWMVGASAALNNLVSPPATLFARSLLAAGMILTVAWALGQQCFDKATQIAGPSPVDPSRNDFSSA